MKIYPSPNLKPNEYVPGLGAAGAEFPDKKAEALVKAGLAIKEKPPAKPAKKPEA